MKQSAIVSIVFIVGCTAGGVAAQLVVPPVRAGTAPTRWEYKCADIEDRDYSGGLTTPLNAFGDKGWELVSLLPSGGDTYLTCAKRPLR
jgi:hypothetical protein